MKQHLDSLAHALTQKGWRIASTRSLNDFPYDCNAWTIRRGETELEIQFDRFGDMGQDISLLDSSGCSIDGHDSILLSFSKPPKWKAELETFVSKLDSLSSTDDRPYGGLP